MATIESETRRHETRLRRIAEGQAAGRLTQERADEQRADENERHAKILVALNRDEQDEP
jgi:hypothetical protein